MLDLLIGSAICGGNNTKTYRERMKKKKKSSRKIPSLSVENNTSPRIFLSTNLSKLIIHVVGSKAIVIRIQMAFELTGSFLNRALLLLKYYNISVTLNTDVRRNISKLFLIHLNVT